jgi:quercetin dioxygenase-like cupin family protein
MIVRVGDKRPKPGRQAGLIRSMLCHGRRLMLTESSLTRGCTLAAHAHPHEEALYVVRGSVKLLIEQDEAVILAAGESCLIHPGQKHAVEAISDALLLDVFSPPRDDLLED